MQIAIVGIDLGKNICRLAGLDGSGQVVVRRRVRRENVRKIGGLRRLAEKLKCRERFYVRLRVPPGIGGSVQTFSGRHLNIGPHGTVEMSADDAQYLIPDGWTKLAEWKSDAGS
jgi:predicted NBD/HSP70 family sugar kinase